MLDNVVLHFGTLVENLLQERHQVGSDAHKEWLPLYTLPELLDPAFVYPNPEQKKKQELGWGPGFETEGLMID